jgi:hypothetical protein
VPARASGFAKRWHVEEVVGVRSTNGVACLIEHRGAWPTPEVSSSHDSVDASMTGVVSTSLQVGPKGVEFAKYSIDYHYIRNYIQVNRNWKAKRAQDHIPEFALRIVAEYDGQGDIQKRVRMRK